MIQTINYLFQYITLPTKLTMTVGKYLDLLEKELSLDSSYFQPASKDWHEIIFELRRITPEICETPRHNRAIALLEQLKLEVLETKQNLLLNLLTEIPLSKIFISTKEAPRNFIIDGSPHENGMFSLDKLRFYKEEPNPSINCFKVLKSNSPTYPQDKIIELPKRNFEIGRENIIVSEPVSMAFNWIEGHLEVSENPSKNTTFGQIRRSKHILMKGEILTIGNYILKVRELNDNILEILINDEPYIIGANKPVTIGRDAKHEISIQSPRVSKTHCRILFIGMCWVIEDQNSTNGVWLCFHTLDSLRDNVKSRSIKVELGDIINFCNIELKLDKT